MQIAPNILARNAIEAAFPGPLNWYGQTDGTWIGYEEGEPRPIALTPSAAPATPPVKTWAGYAEFSAALTLEQKIAIETLNRADPRVGVMVRDMEHAVVIRSDDPRWLADIEYLASIRDASGDANLPSREEWAALLAS